MALQTSGQISLSNIATEFGGSAPHSMSEYYGAAAGVPTSGAISISNFYGKSSQFTFTITSNQTNASLYTLATNAGWDGSSALVATINSGVYISATSTSNTALTISGSYPAGVTLINNGYIVGMGGNGGAGGGAINSTMYAGTAGSTGGKALAVSSTITITNNGTIAGGGGGGGGGGGYQVWFDGMINVGGNGGSGGRTGTTNSSGGAGGGASGGSAFSITGNAGNSGTSSAAGASKVTNDNTYGGAGGNWGSSGSAGQTASIGDYASGGSGGGAGACLTGNSYITWSATGTRLGAIS